MAKLKPCARISPLSPGPMKEFAYIHETEGELPPTLAAIPFFRLFDARELNHLLRECLIVECEPGDRLIEEGKTDARIYILLSGALEVTKGAETLARFEAPGQVVGEMAIMGDQLRTASVIAANKAFCLTIDLKVLHNKLPIREHALYYAQLYGFLAKVLAERLHHTSSELAELKAKAGI